MVNLGDLTEKERAFLGGMVDVSAMASNMEPSKALEYKDKYGCDPCDACGPDACADCNGCVEGYMSHGQLNPFDRLVI